MARHGIACAGLGMLLLPCSAACAQSELAGLWYIEGEFSCKLSHTGLSQARTDSAEGVRNSPHPYLRVRSDGSIEHSLLLADETFNRLRRAGDRVVLPHDRNVLYKLEWCGYSRRESRVLVRYWPNKAKDERSVLWLVVLDLMDDGRARYHCSLMGQSETTFSIEAILRRGSRVVEEARPAAAPADAAMQVRDVLQATTETGERFFYLAPIEPDAGSRLLVILHGLSPFDSARAKAEQWSRCSEAREYTCVFPVLGRSVRQPQPPAREAVLQDWQVVKKCLAEVRTRFDISDVCLVSYSAGGFVGHMLWQTDNRGFNGFVAYNCRFEPWQTRRGPHANNEAPLLICLRPGLQLYRSEGQQANSWYLDNGYRNVKMREITETNVARILSSVAKECESIFRTVKDRPAGP